MRLGFGGGCCLQAACVPRHLEVTKMAYSMVAVYGMNSELGLVSYGQNNSSQQFYKPYSATVAVMGSGVVLTELWRGPNFEVNRTFFLS